jgi:hypothetical protein
MSGVRMVLEGKRQEEKEEGKMSEIKNCTMMMELYRIFWACA